MRDSYPLAGCERQRLFQNSCCVSHEEIYSSLADPTSPNGSVRRRLLW